MVFNFKRDYPDRLKDLSTHNFVRDLVHKDEEKWNPRSHIIRF